MRQELLLLLLLCLIAYSLSQIVPMQSETLWSIYHSNKGTPTQEKAMEYLLLTYPQLGSYSNVTMMKIVRANNYHNLQDVYFILYSNNTRVSVIATLSQTSPGEFISISPLITTIEGSNNITSSQHNSRSDSNFYIISGTEIKIIPSENQATGVIVPGGFQEFTLRNDTRLQRAQALLDSLHPGMVNYKVQKVDYQVVSGIKFNIKFVGDDQLTMLNALVLVNLQMEPFLLGFQIRCLASNSSNMVIGCNDSFAFQIFSACESLMLIHPELLAYEMISMVSDDSNPYDGVLFIITYENNQTETRVMAEINIAANVFSVMSYYSYAYPLQ